MSRHRTPEELIKHRDAEKMRWESMSAEQKSARAERAKIRYETTKHLKNRRAVEPKYCKDKVPILDRDACIYLAGLFDGEGCFMIKFASYRGGEQFSGCIRIAMTCLSTIEWVAEKLGKKVQKHSQGKIPSTKWKPVHRVQIANIEGIISFIEQIYPFMITKKEAAKVLLSFCYSRREIRGVRKPYTPKEREFFSAIRQLNRVGLVDAGFATEEN